jgi:hypothetical protein
MAEHRTSRAWTSLCCLFLLLAPNPGETEVIIHPHTANALRYCVGDKIYSVHSTGAPSIIAASFAGDGKQVAFRTCQDGDGNIHYFIRKPRPNRNGVCRTFEDEVFPGTDGDRILVDVLYDGSAPNWYFSLKGWKAWPPDGWTLLHYTPRSSVLGFVSNEDCPTGEDARYLSLANVTDGMLKAFQSTWIEATRSSETLDKAFRNVPTVSGATGKIDPQPSQALRDRLSAAVFVEHDKITAISCDTGGCTAFLTDQAVGFDFAAGGIVITKLIQMWVT